MEKTERAALVRKARMGNREAMSRLVETAHGSVLFLVRAVEREITTGTSETTFSPDKTCTQVRFVTHLCRALDS